jgi:hypothetical protein
MKSLLFLLLTSSAFVAIHETGVCVFGGTSGGVSAAVMALEDGKAVQEVDYSKLRSRLVKEGQVVEWRE